MASVISVNISARKGEQKKPCEMALLKAGWGIEGDAHAGEWHRQVSLLALESIEKMRARGIAIEHGDFAENITTEGIDVMNLPVGTRLSVGGQVILAITQIGKECHQGCAIREKAGDCVMPREGVFARVLMGGEVKPGDTIRVLGCAIRVGVLAASDKGSRGERIDRSGAVIHEFVAAVGGEVVHYELIPDERAVISIILARWCDGGGCDLILTTGGTGLSPRDVTPEATLDVAERLVPGIPETIRARSMQVTDRAMLSRAVAVTRGRTLIINLPGSPTAVKECLDVVAPVLEHAVEILRGEGGECARVPDSGNGR